MAKQKYRQSVKQERLQISALRREAREHYNAQRFQQALHAFANAIFLDPQDATSHKGKADTFYALERYEEACMCYEQSIRLDESHALAYEGLGNALYALKKYKEARLAYEQAIKRKLDQNVFFSNWKRFISDGEEFQRSGLFEDALGAYELAILFFPQHSKGYTGKGNALFALGHTEEAQAIHKQAKIRSLSYHANEKHNTKLYEESLGLYQQLIELDPINVQAHSRIADALFALGKYQNALTSYGKVLQLDPKNAYAFKCKGDTLFALKRYKEAFSAYQQAKHYDSTYSKVFNEQAINLVIEGNTFLQQGNTNAALYLFELAILFNPHNADAYSQQGETLSKLGHYQEALNAYNQCIQLVPKHAKHLIVRIYCAEGELFYAMKEYEKALAAYEQAYKVNPSSARGIFTKKDSLYAIGKSFYTNKDYKKALSAFHTGILYNPQYMLCYLAKGNCLYKLEHYWEAFQVYEEAWHLDPTYTIDYLGTKRIIPALGNILYNLAYYREARAAYMMAIAFDPLYKDAYLALEKKLTEKATHLFEHKEYAKARIAYTGAIQFDPANERMYQAQITSLIEMGRTLHKQRKYQEALDLYEGAIHFHPGNALAYAEKGHLLYALHHFSEALMAYTQAMALDSNYRGIFAHKEAPLIAQGEAFYEHGDYQLALDMYEQVLQFNPDNKDARTAKKKVHYKLEQIAEEKRIAEHLKNLTTNNSSWLCQEPFRYE